MNKFTLKILQKQEVKTLSLEKTLIYQGFQEIKIKINSYQKETIKKRHVAMSYKKLFILRYVYYLISLFFDRILIEQYLFSFDTLS